MNIIYDQLLQDYGAITFEAFINLLVRQPALRWTSRITDVVICRLRLPRIKRRRNSCARHSGASRTTRYVRGSPRDRARLIVFQPFVTELDLRVAQLPASAIEYLRQAMPSAADGAEEAEYDYEAWLDAVFE